jgi:uncharacterized protein YbjT (DUF2867 family)
MNMIETVLITGATDTVGNEVIKQQLSKATTDINIKPAVHSTENGKRVKNDRIGSIHIDYSKPETLKEALKDIDRVFLLKPFQSDMVEQSFNLLKGIKENTGNIKHIVKLSVMEADAEPGITGSIT